MGPSHIPRIPGPRGDNDPPHFSGRNCKGHEYGRATVEGSSHNLPAVDTGEGVLCGEGVTKEGLDEGASSGCQLWDWRGPSGSVMVVLPASGTVAASFTRRFALEPGERRACCGLGLLPTLWIRDETTRLGPDPQDEGALLPFQALL